MIRFGPDSRRIIKYEMDLKEIRNEIDKKDEQITQLIKERMELTAKVAASKEDSGKAVYDGNREREVISNVMQIAGEPYGNYMHMIYNTIMDTSKAYQYSMLDRTGDCAKGISKAIADTPELFPDQAVVACQGIPGAYSEAAAMRMFSSPELMFFDSFDKIFRAVETGLCRYGILPIENSNFGSIGTVYDLMQDHNCYIVRSCRHQISHRLLAKPGTKLSDIKLIISHEQAIGQCRKFLDSLEDVEIHSVSNTAVAAREVAESQRSDIAAISSPECADLYGLEVIDDDIQISDHNFTRFICISRQEEIYPGDNRISLMLKVEHKPMSLYHTLGKMSTIGINICKLESRPIPGSDFEFLFYFDLDASVRDPKVLKVIDELSSQLDFFVFLGAYQEI